MSELPTISGSDGLRARRWDALILGASIPALVAGIRLGQAGHSVLFLEEDAARDQFAGLREPFLVTGAERDGPLHQCLDELKIALIERRRVVPQAPTYQVVSEDLRLDVGDAKVTAEELAAWNLAAPDMGRSLVRALGEAAQAEQRAMLDSSFVRAGRRLARSRSAGPGSHLRGMPAEASTASPELAAVLATQVRALSNLATATPSPEAQARLLGAAFTGGFGFDDGPPWLTGILRDRVQATYGEFRSLPGKFDFVTAGGHAGIVPESSSEVLLGRALVVGVSGSALAGVNGIDKLPSFLRPRGECRRRIALHFRARRKAIPEPMASRVILPGGKTNGETTDPADLVTLTVLSSGGSAEAVDLIARGLAHPDEAVEETEARIEARVRSLLPFAGERSLVRRPIRRPVWDDDEYLEDPRPSDGWPGEAELQVSSRPLVYHLQRAAVAGLGFEGDLLLGWRAGDGIAAELQ